MLSACACFCLLLVTLHSPTVSQTPLIMTAIQTNSKSIYLGPGIWMTSMAAVTVVSCLILLRYFPATNR